MLDQDLEGLRKKYPNITIQTKEKPRKKGRYSKAIVALCILLAVGYTAFCLVMQYRTGTQPEPQLTIAFFAFISAELWNLGKIKRQKSEKSENAENRKDV